jgi:hypothetical protein
MVTLSRRLAPLLPILLLAACGGSGDSASAPPTGPGAFPPNGTNPAAPGDPVFRSGGSGTATASAFGYRGNGQPVTETGTITVDLATAAVSGGGFDGTLSAAGDLIVLTGGAGQVTLAAGGRDFARLYDRQGTLSDVGVIGLVTPADQIPRGAASYLGRADVTAVDDAGIYTLAGTAVVDADFPAGTVTVHLTALAGTGQVGAAAPVSFPNAGTVTVSDARLTGATFAGGTPSLAGTPFSAAGPLRDAGSAGAFFGPNGDEVGGRVLIEETNGSLRVLGRFIAD